MNYFVDLFLFVEVSYVTLLISISVFVSLTSILRVNRLFIVI
jgi:hypothetical protein